MPNKELRSYSDFEVGVTNSTKEGKNKTPKIVGTACLYNSLSEDLGGFREIVLSGAFDKTDLSDVRALFNHDDNYILGRTTNESLKLTVDDRGLHYEITPIINNTIHDLIITPIGKGLITQSSFAFIVGEDRYVEDESGNYIREIISIDKVYDVSPVTYPAYTNTESSLRNLTQAKELKLQQELAVNESIERDLFLINNNL